MTDQAAYQADIPGAEAALKRDLARGDAMAAAALPILRHLVAAEETALFSEEVLARVRGMLADVASQVLDGLIGDTDRGMHAPDDVGLLTRTFLEDEHLLQHVHALAMEWQLTEALQERMALDTVSSPLLQTLMAAPEPVGPAGAFFKAQVEWCQAQRRMALPLAELPLDVLQSAIASLRRLVGADTALSERVIKVEERVERTRSGTPGRLDLAMALTAAPEVRHRVLAIGEAGVALFFSGLSRLSHARRDALILACRSGHGTRVALALLAAGATHRMVEEQLLVLAPQAPLPTGFERIDGRRASELLAADIR